MSIRSTTGCYTCKIKRKKCDETKPKCLRAKSPHEQQSSSATIPEGFQVSDSLDGVFDYPLHPSPDLSWPLDTGWEGLEPPPLPPPTTVPSYDLFDTQDLSSQSTSVASLQSLLPRSLTSNQASLLGALLSLGGTDPSQQSSSYPWVGASQYIQPNFHAPYGDLHAASQPILHELTSDLRSSSYQTISASNIRDEPKEEDGEPECIKGIMCPFGLDWNVESNTIPFVLQSYAQWISLAIFDPLKVAHRAREMIIDQFSQSPVSRSRLVLIARLMRILTKSWALEEPGRRVLGMLRGEVWRKLTTYQAREWPAGEQECERASATLDNTVELINIQLVSAPLSYTLQFLQVAAPVFLAACTTAHPRLFDILMEPGINFRHFATIDVANSVVTGIPMFCRYHVPWSLALCDEITKREDQGLRWLLGIPDQFILLFAHLNGLKEEASAVGKTVDPRAIEQVEEDLKNMPISMCESNDPALAIGRMVVQECWREAVLIYLYMALGGANALESRVEKAQKGFMRLVNGVKPGRHPDGFLIIPMIIAGVATTKLSDRKTIRSRILAMPECALPNTAGNDSLRMIEDIWTRAELEGRPARWDDLREACRRVTGF